VTLLALAVAGRGIVDPSTPVVHADDEGFLRGRAAFETTRVYSGKPFRLERHLERLEESAARLGLAVPPRLDQLAAGAVRAAGPIDAFLRIYVTPGREGSGEPQALALVGELPTDLEAMRARGIALAGVPVGIDPPGLLGGVKSTSYAVNMVAVDEARRRGADDAVFLARDGIVLEGPTTNIWWRSGETLHTPALELGVLAGVTREVILETARYPVEEGTYRLDDLLAAGEAFTSSSVREVMPVVRVDERPIGDGKPGPAAKALQDALRALT
jgi:branched-subunit amino acid aminotransferase/4-amino-4-deoxychorismate lyase